MANWATLAGALSGLAAVALGAFGAHALRDRLTPDLLSVWKTANEYHFYHALALVLIGLLARGARPPTLDAAAWCMLGGTLLFSGSLYLLALSGVRWLGAITPLGGVLFLLGWACLAWAAWRS